MKNYTFRHGGFEITLCKQKNVVTARDTLDDLLYIIERQISFTKIPTATDFELINIEDFVE